MTNIRSYKVLKVSAIESMTNGYSFKRNPKGNPRVLIKNLPLSSFRTISRILIAAAPHASGAPYIVATLSEPGPSRRCTSTRARESFDSS